MKIILNKKKWTLILLLVISIMTIYTVSTSAIATTRATFKSTEVKTFEYPPLRQWIDEDGVFHAREQLMIFTVYKGELQGTLYYIGDVDLNLATGDGSGSGENWFIGEWKGSGNINDGEVVLFSGRSKIKISGFVVTGTAWAIGRVGGMKAYFYTSFTDTGNPSSYTDALIDPNTQLPSMDVLFEGRIYCYY
jgi:hypothetical protein